VNGRAKVTILLVVRVVIALRSAHLHIDEWRCPASGAACIAL
jgi:hypothetical protein